MPSAPDGARVTSAGSWYRQENSKKSDARSTAAAEVNNSRQASASCRVPGPARRRSRAAEPARLARTSRATVELVGAQERGAWPPDGRPAATEGAGRGVHDLPRGMRAEVRERRLELPAGDGRVPGAGRAGEHEQLQHVPGVGTEHLLRLLGQHPVVEVGKQAVGLLTRQVGVVRRDRAASAVLQPVGPPGLLRPGRAQAPLGGGQPEGGAVGGGRHPAVEGGDAGVGQEEVVGEQVVGGLVGQDGQREGHAHGGRLADDSPTWAKVAEVPSTRPATAARRQLVSLCQSRMARPATISAWNQTSGMTVCSICSW